MLDDGALNCCVVHIHVPESVKAQGYLYRFFTTWKHYAPGAEATTIVVCNGAKIDPANMVYIDPSWHLINRPSNEGHDIGAYMEVARCYRPDLIVCLGSSVYFHRTGWLKRLLEAHDKHGFGMFGLYSSNHVRPHLNTTAFAAGGLLLASYPERITTKDERYSFEHGEYPFWKHVQGLGRPVKLVTWDGEFGPGEWRGPQNIFWRVDQSNCLAYCSHTDRYRNASPEIQRRWARGADTPYNHEL